MISAAQAVSAMQAAEATSPRPQQQRAEVLATPPGQQQQQQVEDELRSAAVKMRLELPLKERIIHLQTFKYTFTGQQAVTFLQQRGLASNAEVAADMCQRMLSQALFKSIYHREVFSADGEVYRFSSSFPDGNKQKPRIPGSITSTGLYKEIAKIGKTAAQPFKNIQLSLNDTFNSLGSLTIPTAAKPGQLGSSLGGGRPRTSSSNGTARTFPRRSQTGKLHHVYSDSMHGLAESSGSLADLVSSIDALQASIKESTSLLRLDLQQHTALQEHIVGVLMAQQDSSRNTQLLVGLNAFALLLLLGFSGGWAATFAAGCLMAVLLYVLGFEAVGWLRQPAAAAEAVSLRRSSVTRGAEQPLRKASRSLAGAPTVGVEVPGVLGGSVHEMRSDGEHDSDEAEDLEDAIPYSEDFDDWPDAPVMLCPDPAAAHQEFEVEGPGPCHALALNGDPIPFETELFKGVVAVYIRHLPTTPTHLFKGKKRLAWVALQGVFKRPVLMDHLVYGMEFSRQLSNLPAPWFLENMLLPLARKISPSLRVGTLEDPFFFSPIITASQVVNVSLPGKAPPLMDAKEDTRLLLDELGGKAGDGLTVASRRRYFQAAGNRAIPFSMSYVWTFHLWQEYIDYASYMLNMGYSSYDLVQHLDGQPLQLMAKDESTGQQLIALHVWHTNLVRCLARRLPRKARPSRISNVSLDDAGLHHPSVHVTTGNGGATDTDTAVASPTSTLQQTPERVATPSRLQVQQQEQQQQQSDSAPLPVLDFSTTPHQQQQQDQFEDALESQEVQQQQQQQQTPELRQQQQLPHSYSSSSRQSDSSAIRQQQQQQVDGPTQSSHSDSRLERPKGLRGYRDSEGSMSDPDSGIGSAAAAAGAGAGLPQLSCLRPASQSAGAVVLQQGGRLQQQLSLPAQRQVPGDSQISLGDPQPSSASASAAAAAAVGGSSPRGASVAFSAAAGGSGGSPMDSWSAATRTLSSSRAGRLCSTASGASVSSAGEGGGPRASTDGASSPLACGTPRNLGGSSGSGSSSGGVAAAAAAAMLRAQPHLGQQQQQSASSSASAKKQKKKEQWGDKEERQRQQLHGLSVMGAL